MPTTEQPQPPQGPPPPPPPASEPAPASETPASVELGGGGTEAGISAGGSTVSYRSKRSGCDHAMYVKYTSVAAQRCGVATRPSKRSVTASPSSSMETKTSPRWCVTGSATSST